MDKNRIWLLGSVVVMVAVVALGFLLGIQPQLKAIAAARADSAAVEAVNVAQTATLDKLKLDFAGIDDVRDELEPLADSVPTGTEIPAFVNQLSELAAQSQVTVTAITVSDAVAYAPVAAPAPAAEPAPVAEEGETAEEIPVEVAPAATAGLPPVVDPLITAENFASLAVQISIQGGYGRVLDFVEGLQSGERLFLVSGISTVAVDAGASAPSDGEDEDAAPALASGAVDATISGLVYVLVPDAGAALNAAE